MQIVDVTDNGGGANNGGGGNNGCGNDGGATGLKAISIGVILSVAITLASLWVATMHAVNII